MNAIHWVAYPTLLLIAFIAMAVAQHWANRARRFQHDLEEWETLREEAFRQQVGVQQQNSQLWHDNQYLKANSVLVDQHNPLNVDVMDNLLYDIFLKHGMYGARQNVEARLGDKQKRPRNLQIIQLDEGQAVAWVGQRLNPPYGLRLLIERYEMKERAYA